MKPVSPNAEGQVIPGDIQSFIEQLQNDDDDLFRQFFDFPSDETPAYVQPSVDGRDDTSTYLGSEDHAPPLTSGQTLSPLSRSRASPSSPGRLEDGDPQAVFSTSWSGRGFDGLDSADCLRYVGGGPEIHIQGPMSPSPKRLEEDDISIHLSPRSSGHPAAPLSPPAQAVPMKRGRSNPLPGEKRVKVSNMRRIKACMRCHIRKRECDEGISCKHCRKAFPKHPEVCVREKLLDVRFPDDCQGADIWTREPTCVSLLRQNWQLSGTPYRVVVKMNQSNDSPGLALTLQPYAVNARPVTSATGYYSSQEYTGFSSAPMPTVRSWSGMQLAPNLVVRACLASGQEHLSRNLLLWAERQLLRELYDKKTPDFEAAILSFLLVYRDSPLDLNGAASSSVKKKLPACIDPKTLVRKVCEMRCWYLIWQTSRLYKFAHGGAPDGGGHPNDHSQLPPTVIWELRKIATEALIACEKEILLELDELSPDGARLIELPLWACIWQLILIYRKMVSGYSNRARSQSVGSLNGGSTGLNEVSALAVVENLYRLLVIKYSAYFGSASPIFPKKGQPPTTELLEGDERLRREWDNVLLRRIEFYRTLLDGVATDVPLRTLVVDVENALEHRLRRRPK
ncbi:hypothetical protein FJTKL_09991 [Diaporthe vaccinii]|uniref:Zn(2)-C6 fungal-type domain-containing protein n=1 Tax=Diaporthe vaccinii TaxID=105482 RepID=A0ABR4ELR4_9PEZI